MRFRIILIILLGWTSLFAQEFPKEYFRSPLDIPLFLSGNFGELRTNHYHSGIDIKTQGREGCKVYAAADGFVSRIKVSPWGYGNVLYITHPNGYTTVYAHLQKFSPKMQKVAHKYQYARKSFAFDKILPKDLLKVKKGEVIAISGNSGSSGGPHLHFEIRETVTEKPTNPLLFGFAIKDKVVPVLRKLYLYDLDATNSPVRERKAYGLVKKGNTYTLADSVIPSVSGRVGFALDMRDYMDEVRNYYGIYKLRLYIDDVQKHSFTLNQFSFAESRYINAHIDYQLFKSEKRRIHKLFHEPNHKESFCEDFNTGISFNDIKLHTVLILVEDAYGNKVDLKFSVQGTVAEPHEMNLQEELDYTQKNRLETAGFWAEIPANTFYRSIRKQLITQYQKTVGGYAPNYRFFSEELPLHKAVKVGILPQGLPKGLKGKAFVARKHKNKYEFVGNRWSGNYLTATTKNGGDFTVLVDTIAPVLNRWKGAGYRKTGKLRYKIADKLSEIKSYNGYIDGKWVLFEYDPKKALLWHTLTRKQIKRHQKHKLRLVVTDNCGNKVIRKATFSW